MKYNQSLDLVLSALVDARQGKVVRAAKLFALAASAGDAKAAIRILETSNAVAHAAVTAAAAAEPVVAAAVAAPAAKAPVKAAKAPAKAVVTAADLAEADDEEFDNGDDADLDALVGEGDESEEEDEEGENLDEDLGDADDDGSTEDLDPKVFATVLAQMYQNAKRKPAVKK